MTVVAGEYFGQICLKDDFDVVFCLIDVESIVYVKHAMVF